VYPINLLSGIMEKVTCIKIWEYIYPLTCPGLPTLTQWYISKARKTLGFIFRKFYRNVNTSIIN